MIMTPLRLVFVILLIKNTLSAFMKNEYHVEVEKMELCPNHEKIPNPKNLRFFRYNRTHKAVDYDLFYDRPLDENVGGKIEIERWGDGGWISLPSMPLQKGICEWTLKHFKESWIAVYENAGVENPDKCPIPATKGAVTVDLETLSLCPDNSDLETPMGLFRIDRFNRTHKVLNAFITLARPIDEDVEAFANVERWADGGWKTVPLYPPVKDPCKSLQNYCLLVKVCREELAKSAKAMGWEHYDKCPMPAGNYSLHNYPVTLQKFEKKVAGILNGRYRVTYAMRRMSTNKKIFCVTYTTNFQETHH